ncbi:MAG: 50S ribosomal protein L25 [Clostridiaceae bacterium]|nr:50S ribosomal protein L25 [Clostridiaceae bacterium]
MEMTVLKAVERSGGMSKVRNTGFIPGVLNGPGTVSTSVQFEKIALNKIITKHGSNAKIWVELGDEKKLGFIKEVQRHPVDGNIIHVAIQLVSKDQEIKMKLMINFSGQSDLERRLLKLQVYKTEIEVAGKTDVMPELAVVDVSEKTDGENITAVDFHLPSEIKILDAENEVYAVIKAVREVQDVEPEEDKPAK